jgi:hypothetical protein
MFLDLTHPRSANQLLTDGKHKTWDTIVRIWVHYPLRLNLSRTHQTSHTIASEVLPKVMKNI